MRYGRTAHIHKRGEIDNALLGVTEYPEDTQARAVSHLLKKLGDGRKALIILG
jgi:hypothetical protein